MMSHSTVKDLLNSGARNVGTTLDLKWVSEAQVNQSAVERRAREVVASRGVKKNHQAAWLLRAISCIDLTTLGGDDTPGTVRRLCAKARQPLRPDLVETLGIQNLAIRTAAVCVYHEMVSTAVGALKGTGIPVAAVAAGFPHGLSPMKARLQEIRESVEAGAAEIDIVITRSHVLCGEWTALFDEVSAFREACGEAHLKSILATGELGTYQNVAKASLVAMMAGTDFIKTSTGKESVNATIPVGLVMARAARDYYERTNYRVGFKPAGGIRTAKDSLNWLFLMNEELGLPWLSPSLFRLGASGLLTDIERQLEHCATGCYSSARNHPSP